MGDAAHQVAVVLAAQLLPVVGAEGVAAAVDGCFAGDGLFQQGIRVAHGLSCRGVDQPLAHKPRQRDRAVYRHDDAVGGLDLVLGQFIAHAARAVRLHFDGQAPGLSGLL